MPYLLSTPLALALVSTVLAQVTTTSSYPSDFDPFHFDTTATTSSFPSDFDPFSFDNTATTTSTSSFDPNDPFSFGTPVYPTSTTSVDPQDPFHLGSDDPFNFTPSSTSSTTIVSFNGPVVTPTGPVIPITFPYSFSFDSAPTLVASLVGTASALTTLVIGCPAGTAGDNCGGFIPSVTVTAGSSTFNLIRTWGQDQPLATLYTENCSFASQSVACTTSKSLSVGGNQTATASPTETLFSTTYTNTVPAVTSITVTAGPTAGLVAANGSTTTSSTATSSSSTFNHAGSLVPGGLAAGLMGIAAVFL